MSLQGCTHITSFLRKNTKNKENLKLIHAVFVVGTTKGLRTKLNNSRCRICKNRGPYLHACLECVFFGCLKHIRDHSKNQKHCHSIELNYGQIHCIQCNDYVYDSEIDAITMDNKMKAKTFKRKLFDIDTWNPSEDEKDFLRNHTKKILITPQSTVGLRGIRNFGVTCFMNSVLQVLLNTPLLRDYFLTENHKCKSSFSTCSMCQMSKLFQEFYNQASAPLVLDQMLYLVWINEEHLAGNEQQDAQEFLMSILNILHKHCLESIPNSRQTIPLRKVSKCPCIIHQIFMGELQSDVVCQECKGVSTTIEPVWDISLDLVTSDDRPLTSLLDCLECFTRAEHLGSIQKILCSNCKSPQISTKQLTIKTLPLIVTFHLKRFELLNKKSRKISTSIPFPEMVDMTPFMSNLNSDGDLSPLQLLVDNRYTLFGVVNHVGYQLDGGHYFTYIRHLGNNWYECNDHMITRTTLEEVLNSEGYLLFYHKNVLEYD